LIVKKKKKRKQSKGRENNNLFRLVLWEVSEKKDIKSDRVKNHLKIKH